MNAVYLNSTKLINYILPRLEISTRTVFRQSDLQKVSIDQFLQLKNEGYLTEEYRDYSRTTFVDDDGVRRFIRKVKDQYWGYSQDPESPGRIPLDPEDIKYFRFDLIKFAQDLQQRNNLSGKISYVTDRIVFIGTTNSGHRTSVFMGFFADDHQASTELLGLRAQVGHTDNMLVICLTYECPQDLLCKLNHQEIDCATWSLMVDENGIIHYRSNKNDMVTTLKFLDEKYRGRSYFLELNGDKCSVPYAKLVLLLYFVIKLKKDGTGWINTKMVDKEGIIEADNDINHLYRLISELTKCLKQCNNLIQNDGSGNYRLNIPLRNISYPSDKWLNNTYGDILSSLESIRERRKKQKKQCLKLER